MDVLALSLSSEFAARVASEEPGRFRSLALVTPTGFRRGSLYGALVSRPSIRYFLKRTFGSSNVPEGLVDYSWHTTHQPGAERAPYAFLSGRLFSANVRDVYERLMLPMWLAHGTRGDFRDFSESRWVRERPKAFFNAWDAFLSRA